MTKPKRSHRPWFYFVTPVVSVILTLTLTELCFVLFYHSRGVNMFFDPDPFTGYRLRPRAMGHFQQGIPIRINEHGHRDESVLVAKPDGVFRILVLGDSFTAGSNVAQEEAYPEILERLLANSNAAPVEVVNAGVGGWEPFHYAQYYEHYGYKFSPDLIVVGFFVGNDSYNQTSAVEQSATAVLGRWISREAVSAPFIKFKVFAYNHSNLARLLITVRLTPRDWRRQHCADFPDQYLAIQRSRLSNHLARTSDLGRRAQNGIAQVQRIKRLAERDSIPIGVVLIPDENQINRDLQQLLLIDQDRGKFDFEMPQSMLSEMFADAAIPVIDLLPYFRQDRQCLYMNDTHWTTEGHKLAATAIYDNLTKGKTWPNSPW